MTEVIDHEAEQLAKSFRPNRRPLLLAFAANFAIAAVLLGVPYVRGRMLANEERQNFVGFVQCLIGGEPAATPGLSMPRGERDHFAAKVLQAGADWPMSCQPKLKKLAPPNALFLWPSVKQTGADLRAAIDLVDRELTQLAKRRKAGLARVPQRPLEALSRLQAASVLYVRAADVDKNIDNDAIVLKQRVTGLAKPARLPLIAGDTTELDVWSRDGTLEALALDGRGLSYVRVDDGKVDRERVKRTSFLRGVVRAGATPYLVWAMPDAKCIEREDRCADRPTGIAPFDKGGTQLGEPIWKLPGHPGGRLDRVLEISATGRVDLIARENADGGLELVRARLPEVVKDPPPDAKPALLEATDTWPIVEKAGPTSVTLVPGEPRAVARASDDAGTQSVTANVIWAAPATEATPLTLEPAAGSGGWITSCGSDGARWLAYGSTTELRVAKIDPHAATQLAQHALKLTAALDEVDAGRDQVRLLCDRTRAQLLWIDAGHALRQLTCAADSCGDPSPVAGQAAQFTGILTADGSVIAYHASMLEPAVRVVHLDAHGALAGPSLIPAACWEPLGGMCGTAVLASDAQRVLLLARDGPDLLALETTDQGRTFATLSGFQRGSSFDDDGASPLQQHRRRKGLE
jgi:hypothetical protein